MWQEGKAVLVQGKISDKDQEIKFLVDKAIVLNGGNIGEAVEAFKKIEVRPKKQFNGYNNNGFYQPKTFSAKPAAPAPLKTAAIVPLPLKLIFQRGLTAAESARLKEIFAQAPGLSKVYFKITRNNEPVIIEGGFRVKNDSALAGLIKKEFSDSIEVIDGK
jgi:hypothetical protein